jgi:hypothetical protein
VNIKACRYAGSGPTGWECGTDGANSYDADTVTRTGVSIFSAWTPGNGVDVTAVRLEGLRAGGHATSVTYWLALAGVLPALGGVFLLRRGVKSGSR